MESSLFLYNTKSLLLYLKKNPKLAHAPNVRL